jgi:hypothetical protein
MRTERPIIPAVALGVGLIVALVLAAGPAAAQTSCAYPDSCTPSIAPQSTTTSSAPGTTTTTAPGGATVGRPASQPVATTQPIQAPSGGLPVTGQDVVELLVVGLVAIALGAGLSRPERRHRRASGR